MWFRNILVWKNYMYKRDVSRFSVETVLSPSTHTIRRGTLLCFTKVLVSKNVWDKTGGGYHDSPSSAHETLRLTLRGSFFGGTFWKLKEALLLKIFDFSVKTGEERLPPLSIEFFLSRNTEIFRRGPILSFRKLLLSKFFMDKRGELSRFLAQNVLSHCSETYHRGTHLCSETFRCRKVWWTKKEKIELSQVAVELVLSYGTEGFRRRTIMCFRNILVWKDFTDKRVVSQISVEIVLSSSTQTVCRGTLLRFRLFLESKTFKDKKGRGTYPKFLLYIFVSQH